MLPSMPWPSTSVKVYLIVGTRVEQDICQDPGKCPPLHRVGNDWQLFDADGQVFKSGPF